MTIAIVGADEEKFTEEQKEKAQIEIYKIFINKFKWLCPICEEIVFLMNPSFPRKKYKTPAHCPKHGTVNALLSKEHLVLVSGHCPVGEELWYCINCKGWFHDADETTKAEHLTWQRDHRMIKVYDKGGVDTWAEIIATELGIKKEIYAPVCKDTGLSFEQCLERGRRGQLEDRKYHFWLKTLPPHLLAQR